MAPHHVSPRLRSCNVRVSHAQRCCANMRVLHRRAAQRSEAQADAREYVEQQRRDAAARLPPVLLRGMLRTSVHRCVPTHPPARLRCWSVPHAGGAQLARRCEGNAARAAAACGRCDPEARATVPVRASTPFAAHVCRPHRARAGSGTCCRRACSSGVARLHWHCASSGTRGHHSPPRAAPSPPWPRERAQRRWCKRSGARIAAARQLPRRWRWRARSENARCGGSLLPCAFSAGGGGTWAACITVGCVTCVLAPRRLAPRAFACMAPPNAPGGSRCAAYDDGDAAAAARVSRAYGARARGANALGEARAFCRAAAAGAGRAAVAANAVAVVLWLWLRVWL